MTCDQYDTCTMLAFALALLHTLKQLVLVNDLIGLHGPPHRMKQPDRVVVGANMHDFSDLPTLLPVQVPARLGSFLACLEVFGS